MYACIYNNIYYTYVYVLIKICRIKINLLFKTNNHWYKVCIIITYTFTPFLRIKHFLTAYKYFIVSIEKLNHISVLLLYIIS